MYLGGSFCPFAIATLLGSAADIWRYGYFTGLMRCQLNTGVKIVDDTIKRMVIVCSM
jgi:hypothetical protein